jgi:hypothetical protein
MMEKSEFYHGAAVVRIIEDSRCQGISKCEYGYLVNGNKLAYMKYSTKAQSPWRFTLSADDIARLERAVGLYEKCVVGFVCGGDGVCAVRWEIVEELLGSAPGWIAAKRRFSGCYSVSGPLGTLERKVALNQWPGILFRGLEANGQ